MPVPEPSIVLSAPSPWEFGWNALVAVGTMALAVVTTVLAYATLQVARKTRELGAATAAELLADWRPVLTLVETLWLSDGTGRRGLLVEDTVIGIAVRNDGRGPALGTTAFLDVDEPAVAAPFEVGSAIAPGGQENIAWDTGPRAPFPRTVSGRIEYVDLAGTPYETTFEVSRHAIKGAAVRTQEVRARPS